MHSQIGWGGGVFCYRSTRCRPEIVLFKKGLIFGFAIFFLIPGSNFRPSEIFMFFNMKLNRAKPGIFVGAITLGFLM